MRPGPDCLSERFHLRDAQKLSTLLLRSASFSFSLHKFAGLGNKTSVAACPVRGDLTLGILEILLQARELLVHVHQLSQG